MRGFWLNQSILGGELNISIFSKHKCQNYLGMDYCTAVWKLTTKNTFHLLAHRIHYKLRQETLKDKSCLDVTQVSNESSSLGVSQTHTFPNQRLHRPVQMSRGWSSDVSFDIRVHWPSTGTLVHVTEAPDVRVGDVTAPVMTRISRLCLN